MPTHPPQPGKAPPPLDRAPRTDLSVDLKELDNKVFAALETVAGRFVAAAKQARTEEGLLRAQILRSMKDTHRSIRLILGEEAPEISVNVLPLTRVQLERCFFALSLEDDPKGTLALYYKNAAKAFAERIFRYQEMLGHLKDFKDYYGPMGKAEIVARSYALQSGMTEDEFETIKVQILSGNLDPAWKWRSVPEMPAPGQIKENLKDDTRKKLASILYPDYDDMSHFSHGGLLGVENAAILRGDFKELDQIDKDKFLDSQVIEQSLPTSYVCVVFATTLFGLCFRSVPDAVGKIIKAWSPEVCDASALGIAIWDAWAKTALGAIK